MGQLLSFSLRRRPENTGETAPKGPAQVLFFTGVRYERHGQDKPRKTRSRRTDGGKRSA